SNMQKEFAIVIGTPTVRTKILSTIPRLGYCGRQIGVGNYRQFMLQAAARWHDHLSDRVTAEWTSMSASCIGSMDVRGRASLACSKVTNQFDFGIRLNSNITAIRAAKDAFWGSRLPPFTKPKY